MGIFNGFMHFIVVWTAITLNSLCSGQFYNTKPWPTYSLQNMPKTSFTCRDKILGGYYADAETQCQMFHVCVKVAGVGVQDFRFLCPNGTAFDQEAQICADWGDVDCEAATLYYGSDNFDLYRIGSGFDSKRAPYADEEEATFHLQRAETGDARRGKQIVVDQNTKPEKQNLNPTIFNRIPQHSIHNTQRSQTSRTPITTSSTTTTTTSSTTQSSNYRSSSTSHLNYNNNFDRYNQNINQQSYQKSPSTTQKFSEVITTATVEPYRKINTEKQVQEQNNYNQNNDEIFRGSQSQHFYSNKNNGKEDFEDETISFKTTTTKRPIHLRVRGRSRGNIRAQNINNIATTLVKSTPSSTTQTVLSSVNDFTKAQPFSRTRSYYNQSPAPQSNTYNDFDSNKFGSSTQTPVQSRSNSNYQSDRRNNYYNQQYNQPSTTSTSTVEPETSYNAYNTALQLQQQQQIAVEHYKKFPPSTTINPEEIFKKQPATQEIYKIQNNYNTQQQTISTTTFVPSTVKTQHYNNNYEQQYHSYNSDVSNTTQSTYPQIVSSTPTAFTSYNLQNNDQTNTQSTVPRGFSKQSTELYQPTTLKLSINNEKYQISNRRNENYTPPSTLKKFSTLVPKDQYNPTTFKPNTYKKAIEQFQTQIKHEKVLAPRFDPASYFQNPTASSTTTSTTNTPRAITTTSTLNPFLDIDEDDGQYHPELYEKDFAKNKLKQKYSQKIDYNNNNNQQQRSQNYENTKQKNYDTQTTVKQQNYEVTKNKNYEQPQSRVQPNSETQSSEDEFLKTAHSQNIAASGNALKVEKLNNEKAKQKTTTILISKAPTIPPNIKTTKKSKVTKDKDASYDYAYYDSSNPHDEYSEYDLIEEFGRTSRKQSRN